MIDYELFRKAKYLKEQEGLTPPQIADALSLDPRTARKWLSQDRFRPRKTTLRQSKLDSFKNDIVRMLETHPYTAAQIYQRIREQGFDGRYTIVKQYVRKIRPHMRMVTINDGKIG
jgi:transposase